MDLLAPENYKDWKFSSTEGSEAGEKSWSLVDGVLSSPGTPTGFIHTGKDFENYTLTLEWRWQPGSEGNNSGVLFHVSSAEEAKPWPKSFEAQLQQDNAGDFWMIGGEKLEGTAKNEGGRWIRVADPKEKPLGEWNTMTVVCKGDTVSVHVNGTLVNEGKNLSVSKGAIGLQSEGKAIEFRKIVIEEK